MRNFGLFGLSALFLLNNVAVFSQVVSESFETWPSSGWESKIDEGVKGEWMQSDCTGNGAPGAAFDGSYAMMIDYLSTSFGKFSLVSPDFDVSAMSNPEVSFKWYYIRSTGSDNSCVNVYGGFEDADSIRYELLDQIYSEDKNDWVEYRRVFNRDVKKIKIQACKFNGGSFNKFYVDDFIVQEGPEVAAPVGLNSELLAGEENNGKALLSWDRANDEKEWNIKVSSHRIDPETEDADLCTATGLDQMSYLASGLPLRKICYWYVQTVSNGKNSEWASAELMVDYAPIAVPFILDFEKDDEGFAYIQDGQHNMWYWGNKAYDDNAGNCMFISNDGGENYAYDDSFSAKSYLYRDIVFPEDAPNGFTLGLDFRGVGTEYNHVMEIYLVTDLSYYPEAGTYISTDYKKLVGKFHFDEEWKHYNMEIPQSFEGKRVRMIVSWRNNDYEGIANPPAAFDNLSIAKAECAIPKGLREISSTSNSITLDWDIQGTETKWEIEYGDYKFELGTGTIKVVDQQPPYELTGLEPGRRYDIVLRAYCGENILSESSVRLKTSTKYDVLQAPFACNFDDVDAADQLFPTGWLYYSENPELGVIPYYLSNPYYFKSAPNCMMLPVGTGDLNTTLISPEFSDISKDKRVSFWARMHTEASVQVGLMKDPEDIGTFLLLKEFKGMDYPEVSESGYPEMGKYRHTVYLDNKNISEEYRYIAFKVGGSTPMKVAALDDFVYEVVPENAAPRDLVVFDTNTTTARIAWTPVGNEKKWEVAYGTRSFEPDENTVGTIFTETNAQLQDLEPNEFYKFYVRPVYDDNTKGEWSDGYFFFTCGYGELPYMENFDMGSSNVIPACWTMKDVNCKWRVSRDKYYSGPYSLLYPAGDFAVDDYIASPELYLEAGKNYRISFRLSSLNDTSSNTLTVHMLDACNLETLEEAIHTETEMTNDYQMVKIDFVPGESKYYCCAWAVKGDMSDGISIDDIAVMEYGVEAIDNPNDDDISVEPRVVKDAFTIKFSGNYATVNIFSSNGTMVYSGADFLSGNSIYVRGWESGVYYVQIITGNKVATEKIIVE